MDNVERMFRHLVRVIRTRFPQYLTQPFDIAELHQTILPYRHNRAELGLDTNQDYEITLLELLAGNHGYLVVDDRMREALRAELASRNPDPGAFRQFADAQISLSPGAVRALESTPSMPLRANSASAAAAPSAPVPGPIAAELPTEPQRELRVSAAVPVAEPPDRPAAPPSKTDNRIVPQAGERCRACNELLPVGRAITFCPHCGQNLTTINCAACGSELELGWRYCPICGRPSTSR